MHLLSMIEKHLQRTGTPRTRFGREAVGDPRFVDDLRNGREPRPATIARVTDYLTGAARAGDAR
jgi:hypothetical protein